MIIRNALCPNCEHKTPFHFTGEQTWPPAVAAKLGLPPLTRLWTCERCHSTLCEQDLTFGTGPLSPLSSGHMHDTGPLNLPH